MKERESNTYMLRKKVNLSAEVRRKRGKTTEKKYCFPFNWHNSELFLQYDIPHW